MPEKHAPLAMSVPAAGVLAKTRIAVIRTMWNSEMVDALADGNTAALLKAGVLAENITQHSVPGCYELPIAAKKLAASGTVDAVVCIGLLIKGDTMHFEYLSAATCEGMMQVQLETGVPVIYGVLNCLTTAQAQERCAADSPLLSSLGESGLHMLTITGSADFGGTKTTLSAAAPPAAVDEAEEAVPAPPAAAPEAAVSSEDAAAPPAES